MSVVIPGIEMPKNCWECPCFVSDGWICNLDDECRDVHDGRPDWCPLIELPKRLIDADALMDIFADRLVKISERYGTHSAVAGAVSGAMKLLDLQPTVLEKELMENNK